MHNMLLIPDIYIYICNAMLQMVCFWKAHSKGVNLCGKSNEDLHLNISRSHLSHVADFEDMSSKAIQTRVQDVSTNSALLSKGHFPTSFPQQFPLGLANFTCFTGFRHGNRCFQGLQPDFQNWHLEWWVDLESLLLSGSTWFVCCGIV